MEVTSGPHPPPPIARSHEAERGGVFYFGVLAGRDQLDRLHEDEQSDHKKVGCNERTYRFAIDVREDICPEKTGLYRYVRNPMYVAVVAIILGQAFLFGDWHLILYGALFWLTCHLFVVAYEELTLERTFGAEYEAFRANAPRWIPLSFPQIPSARIRAMR